MKAESNDDLFLKRFAAHTVSFTAMHVQGCSRQASSSMSSGCGQRGAAYSVAMSISGPGEANWSYSDRSSGRTEADVRAMLEPRMSASSTQAWKQHAEQERASDAAQRASEVPGFAPCLDCQDKPACGAVAPVSVIEIPSAYMNEFAHIPITPAPVVRTAVAHPLSPRTGRKREPRGPRKWLQSLRAWFGCGKAPQVME